MPEGLIVKALSGYYYVLPDSGAEPAVQCRARGVFKKKGITPLVGDRVRFSATTPAEGVVDEVLPRTTELVRPPIANVEQAVLVFSVSGPALSLPLLDKFLVHVERAGLASVICFSKADLGREGDARSDGELARALAYYEGIGYETFATSVRQGEGIDRLRRLLAGRISVFSGQSGVGKSSLLNAAIPGLALATNEISDKLGRGKHTTRHVELIALPEGGYVADTPGFSQLDFLEMEPEDLGACFREFREPAVTCKFRGCLHRSEPGCRVVEAVEAGRIAGWRYEHYSQFLDEMKERKRRY